ncbi:MAG: putative zinc-binding metallopeptidase [Bacteriovoracaceae bacterium]
MTLFKTKHDPYWAKLSESKLMELRLKDLALDLKDTNLSYYTNKLLAELEVKGFKHFKPHFWFSDEWFSPDGIPGIAIPFYLSHRKLAKIEEKHLLEVEGGTPKWFMQLLRHECGHAIDNAYCLRRRKKRQKLFGKSTLPYEDYYLPKPFSKKYVIHLDTWYAQSHPDEDFAETFAVWLNPRSNWQKRYKGWKAIKKLEYMDELMDELFAEKPMMNSRRRIDTQKSLTKTLKQHYQEKKAYYGLDHADIYDGHLLKLFTNIPDKCLRMKASTFIRRVRKDTRRSLAPWTGAYQYTISQFIDEIILRADELDLHLKYPFEESKYQFISMLSILTLEYIHSGYHKAVR